VPPVNQAVNHVGLTDPMDAGRLGLSPRTVIRFQGRDGDRLEVELAVGAVIDLTALAEAFWRRSR
jgi:hypothetical protein